MKISLIIICFLFALMQTGRGQGISVSPSRIYYMAAKGGTSTQKIQITNPSNRPLELGVSIGDWNYDSLGNNKMYEAGSLTTSCAKWLKVLPGAYFTMPPGAVQELTVQLEVPPGADTSVKVHTALIYLTQLNTADSKTEHGAALKVRVQMGVKLYHSFGDQAKPSMEITNFQDTTFQAKDSSIQRSLCLQLQNTGNLWVEGTIKWELLNEQNGSIRKLETSRIYSLPGDHRYLFKALPPDLPKGKYSVTAIVNYGNKDDLKIAELEFLN